MGAVLFDQLLQEEYSPSSEQGAGPGETISSLHSSLGHRSLCPAAGCKEGAQIQSCLPSGTINNQRERCNSPEN